MVYNFFQDDESLKRWKEQLLGCVEGDLNGLYLDFCLPVAKFVVCSAPSSVHVHDYVYCFVRTNGP